MRPTSVIFLVLSVIMIVFGLSLCLVSSNMAADDGIQLFPEYDEANDYVMKTAFGEIDASKIEINAIDADVNVIGGASESYIEVVNFKNNYYSVSAKNKVVTFNEVTDFKSMLKFWENGFSFNGMRTVLVRNNAKLGDKAINVYVTDEDIKQVKININNGKVKISNLGTKCEYTVIMNDGSFTVDGINSTDTLKFRGNNVDLAFSNANFENVDIEVVKSSAIFTGCAPVKLVAKVEEGEFRFSPVNDTMSVHATSENGTLKYGDKVYTKSMIVDPEPDSLKHSLTVTSINASIIFE